MIKYKSDSLYTQTKLIIINKPPVVTEVCKKSEALKMFLFAISETTVGFSLSIYRWRAFSKQTIAM